jgi:hypothetical protein
MRRARVVAAILTVIALAWLAAQWHGRADWSPPPHAPTEPGALAP